MKKSKIFRLPLMIFFVAKPIYEELDGWSDTNDINFLKFISFIEEKN